MGQSTMFGIRAFNNTGSIKETGEGISNTPNSFNLPMSEVQSASFPMLRQLYTLAPAWTSTINVIKQIVKKQCNPGRTENSCAFVCGFIGSNFSARQPINFPKDHFTWRHPSSVTVSRRAAASAGWAALVRCRRWLISTRFQFSDVTRVRCQTLPLELGAGFGGTGFGKAMTEGRAGFDSSHQPSLRSRRGSRDLLNWTEMIFAMPRRCMAGSQRVCSSCSEFADCRADFAQMEGDQCPVFGGAILPKIGPVQPGSRSRNHDY